MDVIVAVSMTAFAVAVPVDVVPGAMTMNMSVAVRLWVNMKVGLVAVCHRHAGYDPEREPQRQ